MTIKLGDIMGDGISGVGVGTRALNKLSHTKVAKLKVPGIYEDGGGLRLIVGDRLKKRWVVRVTINGKRKERGLGGFPTVSLEEARRLAAEFRTAAKEGRDLAVERRQQKRRGQVTFEIAFTAFFENRKKSLRNVKHIQQWENTMRTYVFPRIGNRPVAEIDAGEVINVLSPIWFEKEETARRLLQRMEAVFRSAILRGHRTLASPCIGVTDELGGKRRAAKHHPSLPWRVVPDFVQQLRAREAYTSTKLRLEFLVLTAARSGEVREAPWSEIDFEDERWSIPAGRMRKTDEPHAVPLSSRALEILSAARELTNGELVFPAPSGGPLSDMTFTELLRDMGYRGKATAHGFRSSFKVWAAEKAKVRDVCNDNYDARSYCLIQTCSRTRVLLPHENVPEPAIPIRLLFQSVQDGHCRAEPPQSA
ncbi:MAG: tyrosine-type recombinase/integrase, partial [Alphaproteobacteria bacterium]|nr:tyrosine-type recombinase/integrase [Alphaproteobacteria bacterium]